MNAALIEQIIQLLIQAVQLGIKFGPEIISDVQLLWQLASSGTALTAEQQTAADTLLDTAHKALQDQIASDAQADAVA
jgi:hypothetical protein